MPPSRTKRLPPIATPYIYEFMEWPSVQSRVYVLYSSPIWALAERANLVRTRQVLQNKIRSQSWVNPPFPPWITRVVKHQSALPARRARSLMMMRGKAIAMTMLEATKTQGQFFNVLSYCDDCNISFLEQINRRDSRIFGASEVRFFSFMTL